MVLGNNILTEKTIFLEAFGSLKLILDSNQHYLRHLIPKASITCRKDFANLIRPPDHVNHWSSSDILSILRIGFCLELSYNDRKLNPKDYCKKKNHLVCVTDSIKTLTKEAEVA